MGNALLQLSRENKALRAAAWAALNTLDAQSIEASTLQGSSKVRAMLRQALTEKLDTPLSPYQIEVLQSCLRQPRPVPSHWFPERRSEWSELHDLGFLNWQIEKPSIISDSEDAYTAELTGIGRLLLQELGC